MYLEQYRHKFEMALVHAIDRMGEKNTLRDACEYALVGGGKRLRPLLVLMTADTLGNGLDVLPAALGVEFFHTASLIADDLPCMDNDAVRRNKPSLHAKFGESVAILASYTLIAEGYGSLALNAEKMKTDARFAARAKEVALACLRAATRCAGMQGVVHGQFLDLFTFEASWETVQKMVAQKTAALFEISLLFGWLFGGGSFSAVAELRKCAQHLGMAFQIADDMADVEECHAMNSAKLLGKEQAQGLFEREMGQFKMALEKLGLWTKPFQEFYVLLSRSVSGLCGRFLCR